MNEMEYGFVCIMDALGVKGVWRQENPKKYISNIINMEKMLNDILKSEPNKGVGKLDISVFSDSVFVTYQCPRDEGGDPVALFPWFSNLLVGPFVCSMMEGLFFRGAVSHGLFYHHSNILIGPAVDDAASYYDRTNWIGINCTPSASYAAQYAISLANSVISEIPEHHFISYEVPIKDSKKEMLTAINWPKFFRGVCNKTDEKMDAREKIKKYFSRYPISSYDLPKYENTLSFFDYSLNFKKK